MREAVARVRLAIERRESVLIYGDYDVDGTLATVLLKTAIDRLTPKDVPSLVRYHIPHRIREGYGVQGVVLAEAATAGVKLVISVDTGIRAFAAADEAAQLGLDLIVTDHHLPEAHDIPQAVAVINPNQHGCSYPFKDLCGAAVAYKLAEALLRSCVTSASPSVRAVDEASLAKLLPSLLKLVAIATVADAVPLTGENRTIVALGLRELKSIRQPGLRSLLKLAEVGKDRKAPTATEIAFRVGPRINAAGRMDIAGDVVQLLLTRDTAEGEAIAAKLHSLNDDRRAVERAVLEQIENDFDQKLSSEGHDGEVDCIVVDGEGWHRGVIGILASRVVERTFLPALVISHEDGQAHGSGRSITGFHLLNAISSAHVTHEATTGQPLFDRFGGHAHAVGFALPSVNVGPLRTLLTAHAKRHLDPARVGHTLRIDAEIDLTDITSGLLRDLCRLEPFGNGNPEPTFLTCGVRLAEVRVLKERHLKLRLEQDGAAALSCLCWSRGVHWPERLQELGTAVGSQLDIVFHLRNNEHPQFGGPELQLCDIKPCYPLEASGR